jgi:hypothetical protein
MLSPSNAYADIVFSAGGTLMQNRVAENPSGDHGRAVWELIDTGSSEPVAPWRVSQARLSKSGSLIPLNRFATGIDRSINGHYDPSGQNWQYDEAFFAYNFGLATFDRTYMEEGVYTLDLDLFPEGSLSIDLYFPGVVDLPVIPSSSFSFKFDQFSNLIVTYSTSPLQSVPAGVEVHVKADFDSIAERKNIGVTLPADLGYILLPSEYVPMIAHNQTIGFGLKLQTTDKRNRAYSEYVNVALDEIPREGPISECWAFSTVFSENEIGFPTEHLTSVGFTPSDPAGIVESGRAKRDSDVGWTSLEMNPGGAYEALLIPAEGGQWQVQALDGSGQVVGSCLSNNLDKLIKMPLVENISIGDNGSTTPTLCWDAVAGADYYKVRAMDAAFKIFWDVFLQPFNTCGKIPEGVLAPGKKVTLRVEARDSDDGYLENRSVRFIPYTPRAAAMPWMPLLLSE